MRNKKKTLIVAGIAVVAVIAAVMIGIVAYNNSTPVKLSKQLELGQKYLSEQDYEQAIVAYQAAIEIDPMASDAYLGLADAYIGQGDLEKAAEVLQTGYDATADERLKDKQEEVTAEIERIKAEEEAARLAAEKAAAEAAERARIEARLKPLYELLEAGDDQACAEYMAEHIWNQENPPEYETYSPTWDSLNGIVLDIHWGHCVFFGEKTDGRYESTGKFFCRDGSWEEHVEYIVYDGEWKNNKPNGAGTLTKIDNCGYGNSDTGDEGDGIVKIVYTANFVDGYTAGDVTEIWYDDIYEEVSWLERSYMERVYHVENKQIDYSTMIEKIYYIDGRVLEQRRVGYGMAPCVTSISIGDVFVYNSRE